MFWSIYIKLFRHCADGYAMSNIWPYWIHASLMSPAAVVDGYRSLQEQSKLLTLQLLTNLVRQLQNSWMAMETILGVTNYITDLLF